MEERKMNNVIYFDTDSIYVDDKQQINNEDFERVKEMEKKLKKITRSPLFLRIILSEKQYKYYTAQRYEHLTILQISERYNVSASTVCRTLALAKSKILKYYETQLKG